MKSCKPVKRSFLLLFLLLLLAICFSLFTGATTLSWQELLNDLASANQNGTAYRIFCYSRFPRTLAAIFAGSALAVSGALIQAVLNNALASPNLIGVNAGAGFFALLTASLFPALPLLVPLAAFLGAFATTLVIYGVASKAGRSRITLILAGVAISGILSAGMDALTLLFPDDVIGATGFLIGSFSGVTMGGLFPAASLILVGLLCACLMGYDLNVLALGETIAQSLGMRVLPLRFCFLALASLLAGSAVSFAGLLGFVGLLVPHICRRFFGNDHRLLLPACALAGATLALLCDAFGKWLFAPFELPVGILLSFLGGPFFLFLLLQRGRGRLHE